MTENDDKSAETPHGRIPKSSTDPTEDYGYYFYPDRTGERQEKSFLSKMFEGRSAARGFKCVANVYWCIENSPAVKLLTQALKSHGCPLDYSRHVSCEDCLSRVNGGFDPVNKQVVVCQNNSTSRAVTCSVLGHELTHMFDYCRAKVDFTNLEHLACTEVRAANFFHCSAAAAIADGDAGTFNWKGKHQECVKRKALMSVLMVRNVDMDVAKDVVDKVFPRCYNDLEPFGRRPRKGSRDMQRALAEGYIYGYTNL